MSDARAARDRPAISLPSGWVTRTSGGSAVEFHARGLPSLDDGAAEIWVHRSDRPAIVLGSAQPDELIDQERARADGWEVGRRRSGGGVVVIVPGSHLWVDVLIGRTHRLWDDDVHRAFDWVGAAWARAIADRTGVSPTVHDGPLVDRSAGRLLCFAGLGAGEIEIDGYKLVGLSQRRTRDVARFQTMLELQDHSRLLRRVARGPLADLLDERTDRPGRGIGLPPGHIALEQLSNVDAVLEALIAELPSGPLSPT